MSISRIGFGAWAIGGNLRPVDDDPSMRALHAAIDAGTNFLDTADVYGDGRSERLIGELRGSGREHDLGGDQGRPKAAGSDTRDTAATTSSLVERSLVNLDTEALDLIQLHCPPPAVSDRPEVFGTLDELSRVGKVRYYGVSVETVDEALAALRYPGVQVSRSSSTRSGSSRATSFPPRSLSGVGILARVPLASGLLTGTAADSVFAPDNHRNFNGTARRSTRARLSPAFRISTPVCRGGRFADAECRPA